MTVLARARSNRLLGFVLRVAVSATLLVILLRHIDLRRSLEVVRLARPEMMVILLAMLFAERLYAAYRWHVLLRCGDPAVPMGTVVRISFVSTFLGLFLPSGVGTEALRVFGLARQTSDLALSFSSAMVDRMLALLALLLLVLLGLTAASRGMNALIAPWAWLLLGATVCGCAALMHPGMRGVVNRLLPRRVALPLRDRLQKLYACLDMFRGRPGVIVWAATLAVGFQVFRVIVAVVGALALRVDIPVISFFVFIPIIVFLGMLPISLGGLGVREAGFVYFFGTVGVSSEGAFTLSLLLYVLGVVSTLPGAWLYARGMRRREN